MIGKILCYMGFHKYWNRGFCYVKCLRCGRTNPTCIGGRREKK
jgi:hypothetical protein